MADSYRIFGAEMSPYRVKVRAYFRDKGIPHQWIFDTVARFVCSLIEACGDDRGNKGAFDPVLDEAGCLGGLRT
jgi:hypothetical protein